MCLLDDDPDGHPTVGWGHLCDDPSCSDVGYPIPLSEADGQKLLLEDLAVSRHPPYSLKTTTGY